MTHSILGLREIAGQFDAVLIDQFGVLHDGIAAFDGAIECLQELKSREIAVVAVTNSGKRASKNIDRLANLGFDVSLFNQLVSSGELARAHVSRLLAEGQLRSDATVAVLSRDADVGTLGGLGLEFVEPACGEADLLLIAGIEPEKHRLDDYRRLLLPYTERKIPALCANPDRLMYLDRMTAFGPGKVAELYEAAGGKVTWLGKPRPAIFEACLEAIGQPDRRRTLMIGDSPEHDIAGGAGVGIRTLLVRAGVQAATTSSIKADFEMMNLRW